MNAVEAVPFRPLAHGEGVFALWEAALGGAYPVSERVFVQNTFGNPYYEPGDGVVAAAKGRIVGFALAKLDRTPSRPRKGAVGVVLVHPSSRRRGVGRLLVGKLVDRLGALGAEAVGVGSPAIYRFWPGVPTDLEEARLFFEAEGFSLQRGTFDLVRNLENFETPEKAGRVLGGREFAVGPARSEEAGDILRFEHRHFPFWEDNYRMIIAVGGEGDIILARRGPEIVGALCTYSPESRFRSTNLVWERILGEDVGGFGSVGVAEKWRGRGLGLALCAAAAERLRDRGVRLCHIDWTAHLEFYGKLGFDVWREYWQGKRLL